MANLTIKDIARMAGVSTTAVSFVLNNRPGVSDATRQKVQRIIRETSFIPNVHTRRLNLGKSFTIHVVLAASFPNGAATLWFPSAPQVRYPV